MATPLDGANEDGQSSSQQLLNCNSLLKLLKSIPSLDIALLEHLDNFNNFADQLASIRAAPSESRIVQRHQEWRSRMLTKLDLLLGETIEDIQGSLAELNRIISHLRDSAYQKLDRGKEFYAYFHEDAKLLADHLAGMHTHYTVLFDTINPGDVKRIQKKSIYVDTWAPKRSLDRLFQGLEAYCDVKRRGSKLL